MNLFIKKILFFFILLGGAYVLSISFIVISNTDNLVFNIKSARGGYGNSLERFKEAKKSKPVDILFIGSSHCYRGFDPRYSNAENLTTFNLGSSNQTPVNSYYLLQDYFNYLKPKAVVIEVFWGVFANSGQESFVDIVSNSEVSKNQARMLAKIPTVLSFNNLIFHGLKQYQKPLKDESQKLSTSDTYISGGFVETNIKSNEDIDKLKSITPFSIAIDYKGKQFNYLKKTILFLQKNNCAVTLVLAPVPIEYRDAYIEYPVFIDNIESVANKYNVSFLNFAKNINQYSTRNDYYDSHHLNQSGVEKFNTNFIQTYNK